MTESPPHIHHSILEDHRAAAPGGETLGFIALDRTWCMTYLDHTLRHLFPVEFQERDQLVGQNIWDVLPGLRDSFAHRELQRSMVEQVAVHFDLDCTAQNQRMKISAFPFPGGLSVYVKRSSEAVCIEPTPWMNDSFFRAAINGATDAIFVRDNDNRYRIVNPAAARSIGRSVEDVIGKTPADFFSPSTVQQILESDRKVISTGNPETFEFRESVDGVPHTYLSTKSPCLDDHGNVIGLIGICQDTTEHNNSEAHRAQLEAANRELQSFSYSVSHDLRTPLTVITGYAHSILHFNSDGLDEDGRTHLRRIVAASERMSRLIDALLALAQLGGSELRTDVVDLTKVTTNILKEMHRLSPNRMIETDVQEGMVVRADPRLVGAVMDNLLRNAWKFTSKRPTAKIEVGSRQQDGNTVFYVKDDGVGFEPASADRLFTPFQRLHSYSEFEGSGVGLSTVQRIIQAHGGRIWAAGAVDEGATFYFTL